MIYSYARMKYLYVGMIYFARATDLFVLKSHPLTGVPSTAFTPSASVATGDFLFGANLCATAGPESVSTTHKVFDDLFTILPAILIFPLQFYNV